jgi:sugar diacid utilization regulator
VEMLKHAPDSAARKVMHGDSLEPVGFPEVVEAFNEISGAITEGVALDDLLHVIAERICALLDVRRCSAYLKDERTGLFGGRAGQALDRNIDAAIKGLTAGIEADDFTKEILSTKRPVLIINAQSDPRPVRSTMLEWNVQTMLGVPMVRTGEVVGLLFLDNEDASYDYSDQQQALCSTFANLAAIAISYAQLTSELRSSLETVEKQNTLLRSSAAIEERLSTLVLKGANLDEITAAVAELTRKPTAVLDSKMRQLASLTQDDAADAALRQALDRIRRDGALHAAVVQLEAKRPSVVDADGTNRLEKRLLVTPINVGDDTWGYLVVVEHGGWFNAHDRIVARRAGTIVALDMSAQRRAAGAESRAQETLARDLINGVGDEDSLQSRASFLGVHLKERHVVLLITAEEGERPPGSPRVFEALGATQLQSRPLVVGVDDGVVAVVELAGEGDPVAAARRLAGDMLRALSDEPLLSIAISGVCTKISQYPLAYREAQQVSSCIAIYRPGDGASRILAAAEIGAARLILAGTSRIEADRFCEDVLGSLLEPGMDDLLQTVKVFFDSSRSVRQSASTLAVHENTIRYRLNRVQELTGLDVAADAQDQMTVQLVLLILGLFGRIEAEDTPATNPPVGDASVAGNGAE